MDKKSQFLYQFRAYFFNSNSIPIPFFSIPIPSPIPGIESGIEFNSHSIPELTPALNDSNNKNNKIKYYIKHINDKDNMNKQIVDMRWWCHL